MVCFGGLRPPSDVFPRLSIYTLFFAVVFVVSSFSLNASLLLNMAVLLQAYSLPPDLAEDVDQYSSLDVSRKHDVKQGLGEEIIRISKIYFQTLESLQEHVGVIQSFYLQQERSAMTRVVSAEDAEVPRILSETIHDADLQLQLLQVRSSCLALCWDLIVVA